MGEVDAKANSMQFYSWTFFLDLQVSYPVSPRKTEYQPARWSLPSQPKPIFMPIYGYLNAEENLGPLTNSSLIQTWNSHFRFSNVSLVNQTHDRLPLMLPASIRTLIAIQESLSGPSPHSGSLAEHIRYQVRGVTVKLTIGLD